MRSWKWAMATVFLMTGGAMAAPPTGSAGRDGTAEATGGISGGQNETGSLTGAGNGGAHTSGANEGVANPRDPQYPTDTTTPPARRTGRGTRSMPSDRGSR